MQKWIREERFVSRVIFHLLALASVFVAWHVSKHFLAWMYDVRVDDLPNLGGVLLSLSSAFYLAGAVSFRALRWHPAINSCLLYTSDAADE